MTYHSALYLHELDRKAFEAMNSFPKFVKLREAYIANVDEKAAKIDLLSSAIRISDKQFSEIYRLLPPICSKLDIAVPEIYYLKSKELNAFTGGNTSPFICVTSRLTHELSLDMISSVLAHECGHIACKHYLYHSMATQLINGIEKSPLSMIPAVRKYLTPTLVRALLFWDRCSELSADRAAVLCDGSAEKTIDLLLKLHGYQNVNRDEFLRQAMDLKAFVSDSKSNKLMEFMLVQDETHPRLATRAYECYEWSKSQQLAEILNGTYTFDDLERAQTKSEEQEVISADVSVTVSDSEQDVNLDKINHALHKVNAQLDRYTNKADRADYALAVTSGILSSILDSLFVGEFSLERANQWGNEQAEILVVKVAKLQGYTGTDPAKAVKYLEDMFPIAADKATSTFGGGLQHHLRDFSHHPTPIGLICSILTQFTKKVYGTDVTGKFIPVPLGKDGLALVGKNFPEKIMFGVINWVFHMVSDVAGSSGSIMKGSFGTGLPGPLGSFLKELSALPVFQKRNPKGYKELSVYISKLFNGTLLGKKDTNGNLIPLKFDLRTEMGVSMQIGQQAIPVLVNECIVRAFFFLRRLLYELSGENIQNWGDLHKMNWNKVLPFHNRTVDRMLTISSMTFTIADAADAAIHAALESGANWVLFSGRFITRFNYVEAGRAALAIVKEISDEKKETQLIHEKMILSEAKTAIFLNKLQKFKAQLEEKVSNYLAEDISAFMSGFDEIQHGLAFDNSDLIIHGNITIQKILGREPQFTNQKEFDELMESETPLKF